MLLDRGKSSKIRKNLLRNRFYARSFIPNEESYQEDKPREIPEALWPYCDHIYSLNGLKLSKFNPKDADYP